MHETFDGSVGKLLVLVPWYPEPSTKLVPGGFYHYTGLASSEVKDSLPTLLGNE